MLANRSVDDFVGHELAVGHRGADLPGFNRVGTGLLPQDPARADVDQAETPREPLRLRPLSGAWRTEHYQLVRGAAHGSRPLLVLPSVLGPD